MPVGPFSGVSAANGLCVVSGGTSELTAWRYDTTRGLVGPIARTDLGRGQPDVLVAQDGRLLYVSTHYWGAYFGLDIVRFNAIRQNLEKLSELRLDGAGFTEGGAKPANFPIQLASLSGDTVLVAYNRGLAIIGTVVPERPSVLQTIDLGGPAVSIASFGTEAIMAVSGDRPALTLLDFSGRRPKIVRRIPLTPHTLPAGVQLTPDHVVLAARDRGVLIFSRQPPLRR